VQLCAVRRSLTLCVLVAAILAPAAGANTPPTCSDVSASGQNIDAELSGPTDFPLKIAAACTDPDPGTTLNYAQTGEDPVSGDVGADPAGFVYMASPGFAGTVTFHYVAHDGANLSNIATVTITVIGAPVKDLDADRDGVIGEWDDCPTLPAPGRPGGCPDRDGDGVSEHDDTCPDAAGQGSMDGCPAVVGVGVLEREARRVARRLGRRWNRAAVRRRAWRMSRITVNVRLPASALRGRGLRVAAEADPVGEPGDGPLGALLFGKGVACDPGQSCRVTMRFMTAYFRPARHHKVRLRLLVSPRDTRGWVTAYAPLDLSPRR
jgi:Bacterial Ig domain